MYVIYYGYGGGACTRYESPIVALESRSDSDPELEPDTAHKNKEPEQPACRSTTKSISYQKTTNARTPLSLWLISDFLLSGRSIQGASIRTVPAQRLSERPSALGLRATTLNVPCAASRFPRASYVQHHDLLLRHLNTTVATYKRRQMKHLKEASETLAKMSENT
jgi:hypothetical protein